MVDHFDVAVCGLGAMGSATTYQLAKRGARVVGLDSDAPPHSRGSTHGDTRITRQATGEGLVYVRLAQRSHRLWREIEAETGIELLTTNGVLVIASPGVHARHHGKSRFLETTIEAATAFGVDHELLTADEIARRFPQFALAGDERGCFEPGGGFVRPEAAVAAQLHLALRHGAAIRVNEPVLEYAPERSGVTIRTRGGALHADRLVLAAGAWLGSLLGKRYAPSFVVSRQVLHWFAVAGAIEPFQPDRFPAFIWDSGPTSIYGLPAIDGAAGGIKIGAENTTAVASVQDVSPEVSDGESDAVYSAMVAHRLPAVTARCVRAVTCMYTTTPDGDFVIDRHPDHESVLVISACSGHGFKHSAAIGEAVAAQLTGDTSPVDLAPFSWSRLLGTGAMSEGDRVDGLQREHSVGGRDG